MGVAGGEPDVRPAADRPRSPARPVLHLLAWGAMTTWTRWATRHLVASRALALVLLAVVALTIAILAGSLGNAGLLATRTAQAAFTNPDSGDAGLQFQTRLADDGGQQDDLLRQALADAFSPVAVTTWTTVLSEPVRLDGGRVVLYSGERYSPEFLELVAGAG